MNAKKAKLLRKMARQMSLQPDGTVMPDKRLMVHPAHEEKFAAGQRTGVTAVNDPRTTRGVNRWLKRNFGNAGA